MAIETQDLEVTDTPINLVTAANPDLTDGESYYLENTGDIVVRYAKRSSAPSGDALDEDFHPLAIGDYVGFSPAAGYGYYVWIPVTNLDYRGQVTLSDG